MEKKLTINDEDVVVRTLTVEQIAEVMEKLDDHRKATLAEMLMETDLPEDFIMAATGLGQEWFTSVITPDHLDQVWKAFEETNSFLSKMLTRLAAAGRLIGELKQLNSDAPSAP